MRFLLVAYCFARPGGEAQIGVYKRCLRVGLKLRERGHEALVYCMGRKDYRDELTRLAEARLQFVDIPFQGLSRRRTRRVFLEAFAALQPDVVVVGEAPMSGPLLESVLCAVESKIRIGLLDNIYSPDAVPIFHRSFAAMVDGFVLTGPSSFHIPDPPPFVLQIPPYIEVSDEATQQFLQRLGLQGDNLVTVLGYDPQVWQFALPLLAALERPDVEAVIITPELEQCRQRIAAFGLPEDGIRVVSPPPDSVLFGLLARARLAVVKYGYMQVTECLALRTPALVVYRGSVQWIYHLPASYRPFVHVTPGGNPTSATVEAARDLLARDHHGISALHDGRLGAADAAANFLTVLALNPRRNTGVDCAELGFRTELVLAALRRRHPSRELDLREVRAMRLRTPPSCQIFSLVCDYLLAGRERTARLVGRYYNSNQLALQDFDNARDLRSGRNVLWFEPGDRLLIEDDRGEQELPLLSKNQFQIRHAKVTPR
ncbi:MAG TPA: hypothetical protein VLV54_02515 [Thermoanaerobaculia bacterium]|nr:hypothetical protein [Thermoanaerobaculia bacterium]